MSTQARRNRIIGVVAMGLFVVVTLVIFSGVFRAPFETKGRTVTVDFTKAAQLHKGDQVRLEGKVDGRVSKIEPSPVPDNARATLEIDDGAGPIYANARASLRAKTLLAGAFYVDLQRGTKNAGPLGNRLITSDHTEVQVEVEDVTSIFQGDAVKGFQTLPGEFATALSDPEPPTEALRTVNQIAAGAGVAVRALRGEKPGDDLPELVSATAKTVAALDTPQDDLKTLVSGAAATVQVTANRAPEIRETIAAGPGVTADLTTTLARLDGTLNNARGLISRLQGPAPDVGPTLSELRPTVIRTDRLVKRAEPLVRTLYPTLVSLGRTSRLGVPLVDAVRPSIKRADEKILPYFGRKDPITGKSTSVMIGGTAAGFGGASAQQDQNGHFIRFPLGIGASSLYLPCKSSLIEPDAKALLACDTFSTAIQNYLKYLPKLDPLVGPANGGGAK